MKTTIRRGHPRRTPRGRTYVRPHIVQRRSGSRVLLPRLKLGGLGGGGFFSKSLEEQKRIVLAKAREDGEQVVVGRLTALEVMNKNRNPVLAQRARMLAHYVAEHQIGHRTVPSGGLGKGEKYE